MWCNLFILIQYNLLSIYVPCLYIFLLPVLPTHSVNKYIACHIYSSLSYIKVSRLDRRHIQAQNLAFATGTSA